MSGDSTLTTRPRLAAADDVLADRAAGFEEIRLLDFARILLARWKLVFGLPLVCAALAALITFVLPKSYVAEVKVVPESNRPSLALPGGLASLASSAFGVSLEAGQQSPEFYEQLATSRNILDSVLLASFATRRGDSVVTRPLVDILGISGRSQAQRLEKGAKKLRESLGSSVAQGTGMVSLRVEARDAALAASIANELLDQLQRFNTRTRQLHARERRVFIEGRLAQASRELTDAEDSLKRFLERNRQYESSPRLRFEYERRQRQIGLAQEGYLSLRRHYDEARIDEVNDTPVLTIIDRATPPQRAAWPKAGWFALVALVVGGIVGVTGAVGREAAERLARRGDPDYRRLESEWAQFKGRIVRLVRARR